MTRERREIRGRRNRGSHNDDEAKKDDGDRWNSGGDMKIWRRSDKEKLKRCGFPRVG